jgi:hypothetical protein
LSALLILAGGCDNTDAPVDGKDNAIGFRASTQKNQTRAGETTVIEDFRVSAQWKTADPTPFAADFMYGVEVVDASPGSGNYSYSPTKYYPRTGGVDFYAYSPAFSLSATNFPANATAPEVDYVVSPAANLQEDFLIAKALATYDTGTSVWINPWDGTGKVPLIFNHALSQILFQARSEQEGVTFWVKDITLTNLKPKGTIDLATQTWTNLSGTDTHYPADIAEPQEFDYDAGLFPDTYIKITDHTTPPATAMMVLPQTLRTGSANVRTIEPEKSHIMITYAARDWEGFPLYGTFGPDDVNGDPVIIRYATTYVPLQVSATPADNKFEPGKRYIFQLKLGTALVPIEFDLNVYDWNDPDDVVLNQ